MSSDFAQRTARFALLAGCLSLGLVVQSMAAQPANSRADPAQKCAKNLRAFDGELQKGGYWLRNSSYGYGYPMYGAGMLPYERSGWAMRFVPSSPPPISWRSTGNKTRAKRFSP